MTGISVAAQMALKLHRNRQITEVKTGVTPIHSFTVKNNPATVTGETMPGIIALTADGHFRAKAAGDLQHIQVAIGLVDRKVTVI